MSWNRIGRIADTWHKQTQTTITGSLTAGAAVDDILVLRAAVDNGGTGTTEDSGEVSQVQDSKGHTWQVAKDMRIGSAAGAGVVGAFALLRVATALAAGDTVTVTLTHNRNPKSFFIERWTNNGQGYTLVATGVNAGASATGGVSATPPAGEHLVLALVAREDIVGATYSPDDDFVDDGPWGTDSGSLTTNVSGIAGHLVATFDGVTPATFGISAMQNATEWVGVAIVLQENAAGGGGVPATAPVVGQESTATLGAVAAKGRAAAPVAGVQSTALLGTVSGHAKGGALPSGLQATAAIAPAAATARGRALVNGLEVGVVQGVIGATGRGRAPVLGQAVGTALGVVVADGGGGGVRAPVAGQQLTATLGTVAVRARGKVGVAGVSVSTTLGPVTARGTAEAPVPSGPVGGWASFGASWVSDRERHRPRAGRTTVRPLPPLVVLPLPPVHARGLHSPTEEQLMALLLVA